MKLSPNFTLEEMTRTDTTLPNQPGPHELDNLRDTANAMEDVRELLGYPILVHSGYRSPEVNQLVRGVPTSAHCQGYACDFVCPEFGTPYEVAKEIASSSISYDQLILEYGWVHISFDPKQRMEELTKVSAAAPYQQGLEG